MSHLLDNAQTKTGDRLSDISLSLVDIVGAATEGQTPIYDDTSASWAMSDLPPGDFQTLAYSKFFATTNSGYTNYSYSDNDYFVWRTTLSARADEYIGSSVSLSAASSSDSPLTSNGTWKQSITVPAGTYLVKISPNFGTMFTSGSSCTARVHSDSGAFGPKLHINPDGKFGDLIFGVATLSSSDTFRLVISDISAPVDIMEIDGRMYVSLNILKLG